MSVTLRTALLMAPTWGAQDKDRVQNLPGWDGDLLSKTYSGHINVGNSEGYERFEHYMFFESEGNPEKDPVIMWTNGGPGAPSTWGSFTELGPYYLSYDSVKTEAYNKTGVPTLFENIYSWTKVANLLIRNLPPPVGYSYCLPAGPSGDIYSCGTYNDSSSAYHSYEFMENWFEAFPEFAENDLHLSGESYAGIYCPTLAREILKHPDSMSAKALKGMAIGDIGTEGYWNDGPIWTVEFYYGHHQFSTKTYKEIHSTCTHNELWYADNLEIGKKSDACKKALDKMDAEKGYNFYLGLYDECYDSEFGGSNMQLGGRGPSARRAPRTWDGRLLRAEDSYTYHSMDGSPCGSSITLGEWIEHPKVREALHVAPDAYYMNADGWEAYNFTEPYLAPLFKEFALETDLRVLIFNGDVDPAVDPWRSENFTVDIGVPEKEAWRPWTSDGQMRMGGYVTRYEGDLDYLTIRGAGHMVPRYKPAASLAFLKSYLTNTDYPRLNVEFQARTVV